MPINERQIELRKGGNFTTLDTYLDKRTIRRQPFLEQDFSPSSVSVLAVDSVEIGSGTLAVGANDTLISSTESGGVVACGGATIGVWSDKFTKDSIGNIINIVEVRDSVTHDPTSIAVGSDEYMVYALVQTDASDGTAIGGNGSENVQLSFCYIDGSGTITEATISGTVEVHLNKLYTERETPAVVLEGGLNEVDVVVPGGSGSSQSLGAKVSFLTVGSGGTTAGTSISVQSSSGNVTQSGDIDITLGATGGAFVADDNLRVYLNGILQKKGTSGDEVDWVSNTQINMSINLDEGDVITVEKMTLT